METANKSPLDPSDLAAGRLNYSNTSVGHLSTCDPEQKADDRNAALETGKLHRVTMLQHHTITTATPIGKKLF